METEGRGIVTALSNEKKITLQVIALSIITIFALDAVSVSSAAGGSTVNWLGPNGSPGVNNNFVDQNQVTASNVANIQVKWIFPVPAAPKFYAGSEGVITTPNIYQGIVYFISNFNLLVALDARDGHTIWSRNLPVMTFAGGNLTFAHYHAMWFSTQLRGKPLVWIFGANYTLFAFNALTGDPEIQFNPFNPTKVTGNFGIYGTFGHNLVIDEKRGIIVIGSEGSEGTDSARGFFMGVDVNAAPKVIWQTFLMPPQDHSDPSWSVNSVNAMSHAYIWNGITGTAVDLKALSATQLQSMLGNDWGNFAFNGTRSFAGAGSSWGGSWAVDQSNGMAYVASAQVGPDFNATSRPGPNLWSASVFGIDDTTGKINWAFQTEPHDLWDFDCAWNVVLANATISGATHKVVFKGCKNGWLFALDASTGNPYWGYYSPSIHSGKNGFGKQFTFPMDPTNATLMTLKWPTYPQVGNTILYDATGTGNIESDTAFDPQANTVFSASYNIPTTAKITGVVGPKVPYGSIGIAGSFGGFSKCSYCHDNTTLTAIDASTGKAKWTYFIDGIPYRGGLTVSGGVIYVASMDGKLRLINEQTGQIIAEKLVGAPMVIQPSIGTDSNGELRIIVPMSSSSGIFPAGISAFPGAVVAFGPTPGGVVTTTVGGVTTTVGGVTTTVGGVTTTVGGTSTVSGIDPTTFYGVTALAVIFIIATGFLALRRRKPAT
jgi:outer membrane protein assembly factor BamB